MKILELFRSISSGKLQLIKHGVLGVCALLSIAALIISFKPKPPAPALGCYRPTYNLNNHCTENLLADFSYYNCAGEIKEVDGVVVPATTQYTYTLPEDSEMINWVKLKCPGTNTGLAGTSITTCSPAFVTSSACNGVTYCVGFTYGSTPWCLNGGQAMNISYGPC